MPNACYINSRNSKAGLLFTLLCSVIITDCTYQESPQELTSVTVGITTSFLGEAATFTASEQGFFKDHGLDVTLQRNSSGSVSIRALFREEVDIAHAAETPVIYSLLDTTYIEEQPVPPFKIFADMIYADEVQKIIARKDHGITGPRDIAGKRIGLDQNTQLDYFLDSFLLEYQLSRDRITLVDREPDHHIEAIQNGEVDVVVTWEPYASHIQQSLGEKAIRLETQLTYSSLWMATTLDSYAEANPDILKAYLHALRDAQEYIMNHPDESQELLARETGVSIEIIASLWHTIDYKLSLSERMLILLEDQVRWLRHNNGSHRTAPLNLEEYINLGPMHSVHPDGITVIQ